MGAYRYMDWLLTVPLLLIEILLVMNLSPEEYSSKAWTLGLGSALMIVSGYYGELVVTGDLTPRWLCWFVSMAFFLYIVYELLVGLSAATNSESDETVKGKIQTAQLMTVISWCTYPVVYLFPMLGINAASAVVSIQIGYCASDIISKCGVGLLIYQITYAKSAKECLLPRGTHDIHRRKEGRVACVTSGLATSSLICFGRLVLDFLFLLGGLATLATPALGLDFLFLLGAWWDTASQQFFKSVV